MPVRKDGRQSLSVIKVTQEAQALMTVRVWVRIVTIGVFVPVEVMLEHAVVDRPRCHGHLLTLIDES
jgi:hypothetical protein